MHNAICAEVTERHRVWKSGRRAALLDACVPDGRRAVSHRHYRARRRVERRRQSPGHVAFVQAAFGCQFHVVFHQLPAGAEAPLSSLHRRRGAGHTLGEKACRRVQGRSATDRADRRIGGRASGLPGGSAGKRRHARRRRGGFCRANRSCGGCRTARRHQPSFKKRVRP